MGRARTAVAGGSSRLGARLLQRELAFHGVDAHGVPFADLALQQRQRRPVSCFWIARRRGRAP
jgi:hypothetical protein